MTDQSQIGHSREGLAEQSRSRGEEAAGNTRSRMSPDEREKMILEKAVHFFAKHGFNAQMRQLAKAIGVSQGLIYRYFKSKDELIERVYQHNFLTRWTITWSETLQDRTRPLDVRLKEFYRDYLAVVDDYEWIRIAMYSGLSGNNLTRRYVEEQVGSLLRVIATECRTGGVGDPARVRSPDEIDIELAWHLHSTIIYYLIRKHILGTKVASDHDSLVEMMVDNFLNGLRAPRVAGTLP